MATKSKSTKGGTGTKKTTKVDKATSTTKQKKQPDLGEHCTEAERRDIQHGLSLLADKYEKIGKQAEDMGDQTMRQQCANRVKDLTVLRGRFGDQRTLGIEGTPMGEAMKAGETKHDAATKDTPASPAAKAGETKTDDKSLASRAITPAPKPSEKTTR